MSDSIMRRQGLHLGMAVLIGLLAQGLAAQSLESVSNEECVRGECVTGEGTLELTTPFGKGRYVGGFVDGEFHGYGRLEIPISWTQKE
ncbi:MAG: hypothetical protein O2948_00440, partial [Proteobacteria bacterium]|nr:hypothetical protein [Pseudomonadota bacterium]